tara:strand:+ start:276 stop:512 length:237 start_codon:yes stop_codon:yes gene_type:complete
MKALISINDITTDYEGNQGQRIIEIVADDATFPIHSDMTWIDCPGVANNASEQDIANYESLYWYKDNTYSLIPQEPIE